MLALGEVGGVEFPVFFRVCQPCLQPRLLLVARNMQEAFDDGGAGLGQHCLEVADLAEAPFGFGIVDPAVHARDQHVFIVAAVEHHNLAGPGHLPVNAPQVVVRQFVGSGRLEADHADAERIEAAEHAAHGAVLAAGVHALQHDQ
ncbi:hypothetical protein D9M68_714770 [compost metagenome]